MPKRCAALEAQSKGVPVSKLRQFLDYISEHDFYEVSVVFDRQGVPLARTVCLPPEFALQVVKIRFPNAGETYLKAWGDCTLNERALALQDNCPLHGLKTAATLVKDGVLDASVFLTRHGTNATQTPAKNNLTPKRGSFMPCNVGTAASQSSQKQGGAQ